MAYSAYGDPKQDPTNWSSGKVGNGWYIPDLAKAVPGVTQDPYGSWSYAPSTPPAPTPTFDAYNDPGYAAVASSNLTTGQHAQSEHDYQYGNIAQTTGYDQHGNLIGPTRTKTNNPGDPGLTGANVNYNPYSQASILKKNFDDWTRGTTNSYAAQGQLYSGANQNAQGANQYRYGQGSDAIARGALGQYHGADTTLQGVQDSGIFALAQAFGPAFINFLNQQKPGG